MTIRSAVFSFLGRSALLLVSAAVLPAQGSLTPPGAPTATGRSLEQIQPRTPIPATGPFPFLITQRGSYYLTGNVSVASGNAIVIQTSDVSLDLSGFTIASTAATLDGRAILLDTGASNNISIANGFIRGTTTYNSISNSYSGGGFGAGVATTFQGAFAPNGVRVSSLGISGLGDGIQLNPASPSNVVEKTTVANVQGVGIRAGVVADSSADRTGGVSIESRSSSNVAGSRTTPGDSILPAPAAPLTVADVQPRTAIPAGTSTYTISAPGSYFLAGNLTVATGNGVVINADNVTLDLNGYAIASNSASPNSTGVFLNGRNLAILNGHIRGTTTYNGSTFSGGGFVSGINYNGGGATRNVRVSGLSVLGVNFVGIELPQDSTAIGCSVRTAGSKGIVAGVVADCVAVEIGGFTGIAGDTVANSSALLTGAGIPVGSGAASVSSVADQVTTVNGQVTTVAGQVTSLVSQVTALQNTVQQSPVDPRIRIPGGTSTYTINNPGSYVLTGDITVASGNCIVIFASDVTLDLGGNTLACTTGYSSVGSGVNMNTNPGVNNVVVRNGHIRGNTTLAGTTFSGASFSGVVVLDFATNVRLENLHIRNVSAGINASFSAFDNPVTISQCSVRVARFNGITGGVVRDCTATGCGEYGIRARLIQGCYGEAVTTGNPADGSSGINGVTVSDSQGKSANFVGASLRGNTVTNCTGTNTGTGIGLSADVATNSTGTSASGPGLRATNATNCLGTTTSGTGLETTGTAAQCRGVATSGTGLRAAIAIGCTATAPSGTPLDVTNRYLMP